MKRLAVLVVVVVAAGFAFRLHAQPQVRVERISIPTYLLGPEDPDPPLWRSRVYPYPMQTDLLGVKRDSAYTAVVLENRYLKLILLPRVGGRLYGAFDKTNHNFDFLYCNDVIKPGLVGLRGAWLSGGIEWNFPSLGHTVTTISPLLWRTRRNQDGSVSAFVGDTEWVRGMRWTVELRLFPERSVIKVVTTLYNRTLTHNNGYYWANAAVHATDDAQVIFPPTNYVVTHGRHRVYRWPVHNGLDLSWVKNIPFAGDFFCGLPGDFNGVYYHQREAGTVHVGNRYEVPGKKFWTWGTARSGAIWEKLLTDHSGQYIEIQAGRLPNQGDTWIFEPHTVERWEEFWYPVKDLGGFVFANAEAAVNLTWEGKEATVAVHVTRPRRHLAVYLKDGDQVLARLEIPRLDPVKPFRKTVRVRARPRRVVLSLVTDKGQEILRYRETHVEGPIPKPASAPKPLSQMSPAELALRGLQLEKGWDPEGAAQCYRRALKLDPHQPLALVQLGLYEFKNGLLDSAFALFDRAVSDDDSNVKARYYRGLVRLQRGDTAAAQRDLWLVLRRRPGSHVAPFVLATIEARRGHLERAEELVRRGLRSEPDDFQARAFLAAVLRHRGKADPARALLDELAQDDPLNALVSSERFLLDGRSDLADFLYLPRNIWYRGAEDYLQLAWDYIHFGFLDDAEKILQFYLKEAGDRPYPLALYTLGWLNEQRGDTVSARKLFLRAAAQPVDYVFPHRREMATVLRAAIRHNPRDWKAHMLLGDLLCARRRWQEGEKAFLAAAQIDSSCAVLNRNLGQIAWVKRRDYSQAARWYERAVRLAPGNWHLVVDLDRLYAILGRNAKREALLSQAPPSVQNNFNVKLRRAVLLVDTGRYTEALEVLMNNTFSPWEGWTGAREVYLLAHYKRGLARLERGDWKGAVEDFYATMLYPENLGTGRPASPVFARPQYFLGLAFEKAGQVDSAKAHFRLAAQEKVAPPDVQGIYRALALRKLARTAQADSLLHAGLAQAEKQWSIPERRTYRLAYARALIYRALGDSASAERAFREARKLAPEFRWEF